MHSTELENTLTISMAITSDFVKNKHCICLAKVGCYAKGRLPSSFNEYFLTHLNAYLFDEGCAVLM